MNSSDASYNPFGAAPMETRIIPSVEVNASTDELIIRIPGAQLMALQGQQAVVPDKKQPTSDPGNMVVLVEEITRHSTYTWLCDLSKGDDTIEEHTMLMLAIMEAMANSNSYASVEEEGMLDMFGGASEAAKPLHAAFPCYVACKVTLTTL